MADVGQFEGDLAGVPCTTSTADFLNYLRITSRVSRTPVFVTTMPSTRPTCRVQYSELGVGSI